MFISCGSNTIECDTVIKNATVLDVRTGTLSYDQNILIKNGRILNIITDKGYKASTTINANGKLVSPGFIDTHIHPTDVFGDYDLAPIDFPKDSIEEYRKTLSDQFLPFGITTASMMGHPEKWLDEILQWRDGKQFYTDFITTGGALISKEERVPYIGHQTINGIIEAKEKVIDYYHKGVRHLKIYHRLREPEFSTVIETADSLNMEIFGHIGDYDLRRINIKQALSKGINHFEHIATIPYSLFESPSEWNSFEKKYVAEFGEANNIEMVLMMFLEAYRYINENKSDQYLSLIKSLAQNNASVSTTIGILYQQFEGIDYFPFIPNSLTEAQLIRSKENFAIMMKYLKLLFDAGVLIRIATDTKFGGKVFLTELKILSQYKFTTSEIFKIATINGAKALGIDSEVGTIEPNKVADLIIWEQSPMDNINNIFEGMTVIKQGKKHQ